MKSYTITVNGNVYDVTVEETGSTPAGTVVPKRVAPTLEAQSTSNAVSGEGAIKIEAGASGKVFKIEKNIGDSVKRGEAILILEIMKMETPVVATEDGTIATINVSVGDAVEAGDTLATLNA